VLYSIELYAKLLILILMYHRYKLSPVFNYYFLSENLIHGHNTRYVQNLVRI